MAEIQKADKKKTRKAYIILVICVAIVVVTQTAWFISLITIDRTGMGTSELLEARTLELFYAQSFNHSISYSLSSSALSRLK